MTALSTEHIVDLLATEGIAPLNMVTADLLPGLLRGWLNLLANPPQGERAWEHRKNTTPPKLPDYDLGYFELRGEEDPARAGSYKDIKDLLHVRDSLPGLLARVNKPFLAAHHDLIYGSLELLERMLVALEPVLEVIDRRFGTDLIRRIRTQPNDHVVRYLAYRGTREDSHHYDLEVTGQAHRDRAGTTGTVLESRRAVQIARNGRWVNIRSSRINEPNIFNSAKIDVATEGKLPALPHRVVQYAEPAPDDTILKELGIVLPPGILRVSIVIFIHYDGIEIPASYPLKYSGH